jgi:hypothetical protein
VSAPAGPPLRRHVHLAGHMRRSVRSILAELLQDARYLSVKAELGEPLSADERARLESARSGSDPFRVGGGQ